MNFLMDECLHGKDKARNDAKNDVTGELDHRVTRQNIYERYLCSSSHSLLELAIM